MIERRKCQVPADAVKALARCLYPAMVAYFDSDTGKREFAEWKATQDATPAEVQPNKCSA